jgi:hypothetical protein
MRTNSKQKTPSTQRWLASVATLLLAMMITPVYANDQFKCVQSGTGEQFFKVCWSDHGNLTWFESPTGWKHTLAEGYAFCYESPQPAAIAYDASLIGESGWGPATSSLDKNVITRTTTDGKLQLKQTFSQDAAKKDVTIKMELKNVSASPLFVAGFARYVDGNVDGDPHNEWDITYDSVMARNINALSLTAITDMPISTVIPAGSMPWAACWGGQIPVPDNDYLNLIGRVFIPMGFQLAPNAVENATFVYRRF